ncbi:hypothetical protein LCGC14_1200950 [marine sediment metagenome]|uniref:Uncharacterized protein n=1 Tax=marine sediment metagenome TaxID=412755 RepID=A0A0F9LGY0_9ZZZZ
MERTEPYLKRGKGLKPGKWRTSKHVIQKRNKRKAFERMWARWQFECYGEFIWGVIDAETLQRVIGLAMPCECCGISRAIMDADHGLIPRSNRLRGDPWSPTNGQILTRDCNMRKGSSHGPQWDFRTTERKLHQMQKSLREWINVYSGWEYIGSSKFVLKGVKSNGY